MPITSIHPKNRDDAIIGTGFAIQVGDEIKGWFTECSGLAAEREIKEHKEGGVNDFVHQLPGRIKRSNITLKHGLADDQLWNWFQKGALTGEIERRNVSIVLYGQDLAELRRWNLVDVYPAKWSLTNFNSANNEVAIETLELAYVGSEGASASVQRASENQTIAGGETAETDESPVTEAEVDLNALTNKVYDLLKQELRLERDRRG